MFSNHQFLTKPKKQFTLSQEGYVIYSHFINLPNHHVLFISRKENAKETCFKKYSIHNLNQIILEKKLEGEYDFLGVMPDHSVLFNCYKPVEGDYLVRFCTREFKIISSNKWERAYSIGIINNSNFFVIEREDKKLFSKNLNYQLKIYYWDEEKSLKEKEPIKFPAQQADLDLKGISALGKNRYCLHKKIKYAAHFSFFIFEIDFDQDKIIKCGEISPFVGFSFSDESVKMLILPNGHLLMYYFEHVQIYDTSTLKRVKELNWRHIESPKNFSSGYLTITAFPDSIHLLLNTGSYLYIFNTENLSFKEIYLDSITPLGRHHVLDNSQLLAFVGSICDPILKINALNLNEMMPYKRNFESYERSYYYAHHFFQTQGVPKEIRNHILSYAFTSETKAKFMEREDIEEIEIEKSNKCLVM